MPLSLPLVSVIVPVHNGVAMLERCLEAVVRSDYPNLELVVVDDGSTQDVKSVAERVGAQVIRIDGGPFGPARARNLGARAANGSLLFFTDADVEVHVDTIRLAVDGLSNPEIDAVFGSYDDDPGDPSFLSQYKNLFHHYVHQNANEEAATFWSGCGLIRRDIFLAVGGFDTAFARPSIEDIELGVRLVTRGGRIQLKKDVQVRHLKRWSLLGLLKTEVFDRGVPWTVLILRTRRLPSDLNLKPSERASAALAVATTSLAMLAPFWPATLVASSLLLAAFLILNRPFYAFYIQQRGFAFAARAIPLHVLYYLYSVFSLGLGSMAYLSHTTGSPPEPLTAPLETAD